MPHRDIQRLLASPSALTPRKTITFGISIVAVLTIFVAYVAHRHELHSSPGGLHLHQKLSIPGITIGLNNVLNVICSQTLFPDICVDELSSFSISILVNPSQIVSFAVQAALSRTDEAYHLASQISSERGLNLLEKQCASDCVDFMKDTKEHLNEAVTRLSDLDFSDMNTIRSFLRDVKVWLSSSLSYQTACTDGFEVAPGSIQLQIQENQDHLAKVIGNGLFLVDILSQLGDNLGLWMGGLSPIPPFIHLRRLLLSNHVATAPDDDHKKLTEVNEGFPHWISPGERKLLQAPAASIEADVTVAQDGSGDYLSISDALINVPEGYGGRYVIYIKQGVYEEVFNVSKDLQNVTFVGDGIGYTIITGNRNVSSGLFNTYRTSTVGISGSGFYARDITFQNTAGPSGHQAVAVRAAADFLVFYRCSFEGYQDTLYALSSRQFYRECKISGTVDFIFGNAISVFQNCEIIARLPLPEQKNTITAHGRKMSADVSGYSFQNCTIYGEPDLFNSSYTVPTYLGRPWKAYSRVVFLTSQMESLIEPAGWLEWNESNPFTDTVYYGEFGNRGAGANTQQRVPWAGVKPNLSEEEATQFDVNNFLAGDTWLHPYEISYQRSLL
ncbi:hypothetical protein KP509_30G008400 [Ceratopteris richardii]|uniref:Pectinesterase n=1 Tax=Ceratopteris richardii TaxID=49495 RepID=A0A8T2R0U6_CERRI|nr:hypothetical protein KP509_30G008400 [Ceratopteris richardii]KAH7289551.1 hypothetical protein KP509_30G008400 [Ceratopteris richardii]